MKSKVMGMFLFLLFVSSGAMGNCFRQVEQTYQHCVAGCDRKVDQGIAGSRYTFSGQMDSILQRELEEANRSGAISDEKYSKYKRDAGALHEIARNSSISMCRGNCEDERFEAEDRCY